MRTKHCFFSIAAALVAFSAAFVSCSKDDAAARISITSHAGGVTVAAGEYADVKISVTPDDVHRQVEFISASPDVFWVNAHTGRVIGIRPGVGDLVVRQVDDHRVRTRCRVTVTAGPGIPAEGLSVSAALKTFTVYVPDPLDISPYMIILPEYASSRGLRYTITSGGTFATIDPDTGVIDGTGEGNITVKIETTDGSNLSTTVSGTVTLVRPREYTPLARTGWSVTTSYPTPPDASINGSAASLIDDESSISCLTQVKPGKTINDDQGNPISPPSGAEIFFVIDMGSQQDFNYFRIHHRDDMNVTHLWVWSCSVYKSDNGTDFEPIGEDIAIPHATYNTQNIFIHEFATTHRARYFKFRYMSWNTSTGNGIQMRDFKLGNFEVL